MLLLHVSLRQNGLVAFLLRHGIGQGFNLLRRLVGLAGSVPQLLLLERDRLRDAHLALHPIQHLDGFGQIAGANIGVR